MTTIALCTSCRRAKNIKIFPVKIFIFTTKIFSVHLHGRVFVMDATNGLTEHDKTSPLVAFMLLLRLCQKKKKKKKKKKDSAVHLSGKNMDCHIKISNVISKIRSNMLFKKNH